VADGIIIIFDVTNEDSFLNVTTWHNEILRNTSKVPKIMIIGNKCDLTDQRVITFENGKELSRSLSADYSEVSSKISPGINLCFSLMFERMNEAAITENLLRSSYSCRLPQESFRVDNRSRGK
jgi:Ras-related protein Rab-1A